MRCHNEERSSSFSFHAIGLKPDPPGKEDNNKPLPDAEEEEEVPYRQRICDSTTTHLCARAIVRARARAPTLNALWAKAVWQTVRRKQQTHLLQR